MLTKFKIENFRAISRLELSPNSITVMTGANGSGKSSLLEAIWICNKAAAFALSSQETPEVHGSTQTWANLEATLNTLCPPHEQPSPFIGTAPGKPPVTVIALEFDDRNPLREVMVEIREASATSVRLTVRITYSGAAVPGDGDDRLGNLPTVLYFPASHGTPAEESWVSDQELLAALYSGQQKKILRNMIARLDEIAIKQLNKLLEATRGTTLLREASTETIRVGQPIISTFAGPNGPFELGSAGHGLANFISLFAAAAICRQRGMPNILLLDEPELHLNPRLQGEIGDLYAVAAESDNSQAIFVTHSIELMNVLTQGHAAKLYQMNGGLATLLPSQEHLILALNEWRDLTPFETMNFMKQRRLLFVEGKTDAEILLRCGEVYFRGDSLRLDGLKRWLARPLTGVGKAGIPVGLAQLLTPQVFSFPEPSEKLKIVSVLDRDYSRKPTFQRDPSVAHLELFEVVWSKHSIESLFLTPSCLASWLLPLLNELKGGRPELERLIGLAIAEADKDRSLLYKAHDGMRQVLLAKGKTLPEATTDARNIVDADAATWQRGKDRTAFVLRNVRDSLPPALQRKIPGSISEIVSAAANSIPKEELQAVPDEVRRLLDHLAQP